MCKCKVCKRTPGEISEYVDWAKEEGLTPEEFVRLCEGTYVPSDKSFVCTNCYVRIGQPTLEKLREMKFD